MNCVVAQGILRCRCDLSRCRLLPPNFSKDKAKNRVSVGEFKHPVSANN
jgi:hypothetical protein